MENYIKKYSNEITKENAQDAVNEFLANYSVWKEVVNKYIPEKKGKRRKDGRREYGKALVAFSAALCDISPCSEDTIKILSNEILEYEEKVKFMFEYKMPVYGNLGICWHNMGKLYDNIAIETFKKYIFYQLRLSNNTSYVSLNCYSFRSCSKYLLESLINSTLNLSSPTTFNDIFDCPILELMNNNDNVSKLIQEAYLQCIKVACFVKNEKVPYFDDSINSYIRNKKKNYNDKKEYLNELMWAHYADSHRGICIKYKFPSNLTTSGTDQKNYVSYFKDVEYTSDFKKISQQDGINMKDAFFAKGKSWKYENELRFLYCNPTNNDTHISLPISDCIEAIYFGVKCPEKDKATIIKVLKDRKCISYDLDRNYEEDDIEFYQMRIDKEKFGVIKAEKILL